jgi:TetR/AcrR family transcriptional regulator, multidrug resistance operon repressor
LEQMKFSPYHEIVYKRMNKAFQQTMEKFVTNAISRGELVELPLEVYWAIAFSPLYVLVKFHMNKKGLPGTENFNLDEKTINQTLKLVLKALKP